MEEEKLRKWLVKSASLGDESAGDVISRLKRASKFIDLDAKLDTDELIFKLGKNKEFQDLSVYVRSQMRRAIKLLKLYEKNRGR